MVLSDSHGLSQVINSVVEGRSVDAVGQDAAGGDVHLFGRVKDRRPGPYIVLQRGTAGEIAGPIGVRLIGVWEEVISLD